MSTETPMDAGRWQVLAEWNDTAAPFPDGIALHELFEQQARRAPGAVAVEHAGGALTYAELERRTASLAGRLAALGAGPGSLVGIHLDRSPETIVAALGVLRAGAAYVPIESTWPRERARFILESQRIAHLLTGARELEALGDAARAVPHVLCLDRPAAPEEAPAVPDDPDDPDAPTGRRAGPDDLAYVIFTSGSTGAPKGVMVRHRPAVNLIHWVNTTFGVGPDDRLLFVTALSFDLSVYDVFGTLAAGGTIRLASSEELRDPQRLVRILTDERITFWDSAPAALQQLVPFFPAPRAPGTPPGARPSLRRVFLSGDWIPVTLPDRVRESFPGARVISLGGATEATIWSNVYPIGEVDPAWKSIPYGRPIANARYYVLDEGLDPCPVGAAGDLYIGGGCLAAGYAGSPDLTADRFLPDPFARPEEEGGRLYRTGDRARYWPDGNLEFLGRLDSQVKIRGYRIELGEIEAAIADHPGVAGVVVLAPPGPTGDRRLVAYVQPDPRRSATVARWLRLEREGRLLGQSFHELPDGTVVAHRNRGETEFLYREIFAEGEYFRHGVALVDGDCVLDVGANIGLFSLLAARAADVRIHAFEPIPPLAGTLAVNAELHGLDVKVHDCGLADADGAAEFTYYPHVSLISGRHSDPAEEREAVRAFLLGQVGEAGLSAGQVEELLDERLRTERVACRLRTLSGVLAEEGIEHVGLLKIDVEKSEMEVLGGLRDEDWPKVRQVVVEVHDEAGRLERATGLLRRHGFEVAVEEETALAGSGFYNVYARRPAAGGGEPRPARPAPAWTTPSQLVKDVRAALCQRLPEYMLPSAFVVLPEFPVSANGKLDRQALPAPEAVRHGAEREHVAPATPAEEALAAIWSEILGVERIGAGDSFLELGGHSLLATQVLARVRDRLGIELALRDVFDRPVLSALAALIEERGRAAAPPSPIVAVPRTGDLPLSFAQERVWFLQQLDPTIQSYQFQASLRFRGRLDEAALRQSLAEIVCRHEIFRTTFPTVEGRPVQRFHAAWPVPLPRVDLSGLPAERREAEAGRALDAECRRSFDVARLPLVRWSLVRLAPEDHLFIHAEHHLVHDGWSFNRLLEELAALYAAFAAGRPSPLPELPLQFADWAVWQRGWMAGEEAAAQIDWWRQNLSGRPAVLELPIDRPRPRRQSFRGAIERLEMPAPLCAALRSAGRREGISLYMLMQAAFAALLSRHAGQELVNVGSAVANRRWRETEPMIGMIVDNVVLANDLSGDPTVGELLQRVRRVCLEAGAHQDVPFDHVVEAVQPERDLAYNPLFQASFSFHDSPLQELVFPGLAMELAEGLSNGSAKFDLNVICIPRSGQRRQAGRGITLLWEYATALFDRTTIERMIGRFHRLLAGVADPATDRRVSALPMLTAEEERQLAAWSRGPETALPGGRVHELVEARADRAPGALAVADGGRRLTYGELEAGANRLARRLLRLGVRPEARVGVCLERSVELPLALLGVLKAGAAYLPLDPAHPTERLGYVLADSAVPVLVTSEALAGKLPTTARVVTLDDLAEWPESTGRPRVPGAAESLAYVVYTSGSTGRPKGTELAHAGLLNLIAWHRREHGITPADRTTLVASPAFDASVWEVWPTLASGASLHVPPEDARSSPPDLLAWLAGAGITVSFLPTPLAEACLALEPPAGLALRTLLTGGDRLHHVERELPFRLVNHYGPTEGTVVTTAGEVRGEVTPPIGRPIDNVRVHVLDRHLQPVPAGVAGELLVGGIGLARGYLERPELTAERFVPDPFGSGERLYRTGDLVRRLRDGRLDFVGRTDHQVKIRGVRVEPGEVEGVLREHPAVREAVVVARDGEGGTRLVAYVAPGGEGLRSFLADRLPAAMVPAAIVCLSELPLSPNGKVDLAALPAPETERPLGEKAAPRTPTEELLAVIWAQVLSLPTAAGLGPDDDFFALGGHSLLATQVLSRLRESFRVEPPLRAVFESPTLAGLGRVVDAALRAGSGPAAPPLTAAPRDGELPLSFAQERLWFLHQFGSDAGVYNIPEAYVLHGRLDVPALARSFNEVVRRHEVLRTTYPIAAGRVRQEIAPALHVDLAMVDLRTLSTGAPPAGPARPSQPAEIRRLAAAEAARPFDLARGPLIRPTLLRLAPEEHVLLLTQHHIVSDGWSMGVFVRELAALYRAFGEGRPSPLPELPIQYADFARWQRDWLRGDVLAHQLGHWTRRLEGAPALVELATDRPRPSVQTFRGADRTLTIPAATAHGLAELSRAQGVSLFMTLLAIFQLLLSRSTSREDVVVGTPIANRNRFETEGLVGFFVNTLVLRTGLAGDPPLPDLLRRVRDVSLDAYAWQDVPFEKLVEELRPERELSHTPLFQVLFALHNAPSMELELPGLTLSRLEPEVKTAKFDLAFHVQPQRGGDLRALARFNRDLFDGTTMDRLLRSFHTLLAAAVARPGARLSELPMLAESERWQVLAEWNDTAAAVPDGATLHGPFEARARQSPGAPALELAGEAMTYGELDRRAERLARRLAARGAGPGDLVGIHVDRSFDTVVAVVGVLKSGAAYVPLETSWPRERLRWILSFHGIEHVVAHAARREGLAAAGLPAAGAVCLDEGGEEAPVARRAGPDDLAYVIFTSGSTGTPKGVMVRHRSAVNLVHWVNATFGVGPADRLLFITALSFDLSVYDLLGTLAAGGTVRIATRTERRDPQRLVRILVEEGITFWDSAPAALQQLVPFLPAPGPVPPPLRLVFLSGDWIPVALPDRVRRSFPAARVISLGGATEATIWSNYHAIGEVDPAWKSIPYGRPIANARYHVLDAALGPCPIGVPGDLYIGGPCLALGYSKAPDLTADRWVPDPVGPEPGGRLYRTGDRARSWTDGTLEFLGRLDSQVKVRGYRIELGEIESVLAAHPGVREAVAMVREDVPGDQRLVAYLIPRREAPPPAELRAWSAERLPDYMVPAAFVAMEAWPLSPTGKLDRKSLPPPFAPPRDQPVAAPPRTEMERVLAAVWREVIGVDSVGVDDNFFDLGGHSLLLARVQARLAEILGRELPMVDLFRYPTVATLAAALSPGEEERGLGGLPEAPAVTAGGVRTHGRIAVVGMAGRFPGARDLDELWRNLHDGVESIRFFTDEELFAAGVHPDLLADPAYVKARGVLEGTDLFDAGLFEHTPREAQVLDPQQRLFLECAWQALEHAGYGGERRRGEVGVFAGASENTYVHRILADPALLAAVGRYSVSLANNPDYLATRVAYKLGLEGPGLSVQTACSTSLVAVHLACRALLHGECDLALAGGASVRVPEQAGYLHEEGGIASPDGHTRAFDARAAGTVRSSGVGAVVLKRLEDALADGDTVHAVVLGSAVNNDGSRKVGFTAPAVEGQARVVRKAHLAAGIDPETIGYVEAHGTGTALGDPVEIAGLTAAFRAGGAQRTGFCAVGTVKSNLGHADAAAGIAGLLKTVLALEHGEIPPSLHFTSPNPAIDFASSPFYVAATPAQWPPGGPRRAGVSSFGIGGTNAHVVLEEAPPAAAAREARPAQLLVLSTATPSPLDAATANLARHLETLPDEDLADAAYTLQVGRKALRCRRAVVCRSRQEAVGLLRAGDPARVFSRIVPVEPLSVAFLFPGQGAQHAGMAAEPYAEEPVFREALDEACELLRPELGLDLRELLDPAGEPPAGMPPLDATAVAQPALFAVEHALARLWMSWGVRPEAMLGHSVGEYVAACLAGVFSLEDGLRLVAARGRLMQEQPPGAMLAVPLPEPEVTARLDAWDGGPLSLAAVNAPAACVVAGAAEDVGAFRKRLGEEVGCRVLHTSHAFHSAMMDPVLEPFAALLRGIELRPPRLPFLSSSTGTWITADEAVSPGYWAGHLRRTVRFADGLATLLGQGRRTALVEVGPGGTLSTLAGQHPDRQAADLVTRSLRRPKDDRRDLDVLLGALGRLWLAGAEVDWSAVHAGERRRRRPLPTYPFERRRYWVDPPVTAGEAATPAQRLDADPEPLAEGPVPAAVATTGPRTPLEEAVARVWRELLGVADVGLHDDFFDLGGSSLLGLQMSARLRRALGVSVSGDLLLEAPTVAAMATLLDARLSAGEEAAPARPTCLVRLRPDGHRPPLFLVHQVGGSAFTFRALAKELGNDRPVLGLRSLGLEEGEEPLRTIEDMARHDLGLIREVQAKGPYLLGGASMGGMVAFEMAHQLHAAGEEVALLALMDTPCLDQMPAREGHAEAVAAVFRGRVDLCPDELRRLDPEEQLTLALDRARQAGQDGVDPAEMRRRVRVLVANVDALYDYAPRQHQGAMVYFRAESRRPGDPPRPELPWIELVRGGTEVHVVPGDHLTMHEPPHVRALAERLRRCLGRIPELRPSAVVRA